MEFKHITVLLNEAVDALAIRPDGIYVDATFGRGGHSRRILSQLDPAGKLIALDRDPEAYAEGQQLMQQDQRFTIVSRPFSQLASVIKEFELEGLLDGVLLDIGVSSPQLDNGERGFSFMRDAPLDMRMDTNTGQTASEWLNTVSEADLGRVLKEYGEERFARRIARGIVAAREQQPILTTRQLAELIAEFVPTREPGQHPATRSFQAIRIRINDELGELTRCLESVPELLVQGGRLVVISFHSLEDRIVKTFLRREAQGQQYPKGLPIVEMDRTQGRMKALGNVIRPSAEEIAINPRARSAIMRIGVRQ